MTAGRNSIAAIFRSPGTLLLLVTILSLAIANSSAGEWYRRLWHIETGFSKGGIHLEKSILHWVNDGLMVLFFLLVGLEIKRELSEGELSSRRKAMLPLFAAAGGMLVPAAIYLAFNSGGSAASGWGIPMATDIAFALAVLSMLKSTVPGSIRIFLTALAIIDDLGAVLVIAIFYTNQLLPVFIGYSVVVLGILFLLNRLHVKSWLLYGLCGLLLWYFVLKSGVHATIAGVLLAMFIPMHVNNEKSMLHKLEHALTPLSNYFILPVFAVANTALLIDTSLMSQLLTAPALGIFFGLLIGKPLGITMFSALSVRIKAADFPKGIAMRHIAGAGILGGIGFTMSIFISMLAFNSPQLQDLAKLAVIITSVIAGITGIFWMKKLGTRIR